MTPKFDVLFRIDLIPCTRPILIAPYRLAIPFQAKLKKYLDELLSKNFIQQSVSPCGEPILFTSNKDVSWHM